MKIGFSSILLFLSLTLFSQTDTITNFNKLSEMSLEELMDVEVFSASKTLQRSSDAPAIMNVITQAQITKMGAITLVDVLKFVPGVEVSIDSYGFYRVALRGARKDGEILFLINGQQLNDFYSGRAIYDMPVEFIEKIEVVRGPGSALFGSSAMAGVINIFTIKQSSVNAAAGNNGTVKANINFNVEKRNTKFSLSVGGLTTKGANSVVDTDRVSNQAWSLTKGDTGYTTNRWNKDFYLNSNFSVGNFSFNLFNIGRQQGSWVGPVYIAAPESKLFTNQFASSMKYDFRIGENVIISPKVYGNINYHDFLSQETPDNYISPISNDTFANGKFDHEKYVGKLYGASVDLFIKANEHLDILTGNVFEDLSLSKYELTRNYQIVGDINKESFSNYDNIPYDQKNKRRFVFAYFLQGCYKIKNVNVTLGVRYDDYSDFGQSFNPRAGLTYKLSKHFSFKALAGKAFRAPTFLELYDNTTLGNESGVKGNLNLVPEKINTYELGVEAAYEKFVLKYNVFYIQNKNLIRVYDPHGEGSIGTYENIGDLYTIGNEIELNIKFNSKILFFANYSYFLSTFSWNGDKVKKFDVTFFDKQESYYKTLNNSPTMRINSGININVWKFQFFAGGNFGNSCYNNNRTYLEQDHFVNIPFYVQGNFNLIYTLNKNISFAMQGANLGKKFSDPNESTDINSFGKRGLIQPGPSVLLNVKYKF
ncbi:MAG: TonB-dependent receptor [Bacteroidota bacterium]|nr:TonB-dependent receptor [Bacteroidota bacterium]